jgi:hypothetical protein
VSPDVDYMDLALQDAAAEIVELRERNRQLVYLYADVADQLVHLRASFVRVTAFLDQERRRARRELDELLAQRDIEAA